LIAGPCGTGKSHLAQALGHAAARQGRDVLFTTQSQQKGAATLFSRKRGRYPFLSGLL
jgi:chromosomal replication initiation ATPase DnaA